MACAQEAAQEVLHGVGKIDDPLLRQKVPPWVFGVGVVLGKGGGFSEHCHPHLSNEHEAVVVARG